MGSKSIRLQLYAISTFLILLKACCSATLYVLITSFEVDDQHSILSKTFYNMFGAVIMALHESSVIDKQWKLPEWVIVISCVTNEWSLSG